MKSILNTEKGVCYLCAVRGYTEEHHLFGGSNRKFSEKYGLKVFLCIYCHREGREAVHKNREIRGRVQAAGQRAFEKTYGSRTEFMRIFGRNYMVEEFNES